MFNDHTQKNLENNGDKMSKWVIYMNDRFQNCFYFCCSQNVKYFRSEKHLEINNAENC